MKTNKEEKNLKSYLIGYFGITIGITALLFLSTIILGIIYLVNRSTGLLITISILLPLFLVVLIVDIYFISKSVYNLFYTNLYETTKRNYKSIYNEDLILEKYSEGDIKEFKDLNSEINKIDMYNSNISVVNRYLNYTHIPLEFFSKADNLINEDSFRGCIKEIINCSQIYRNAILTINYGVNRELAQKEIQEIVDKINATFDETGSLISLHNDKKGFFVYLPHIDSFSLLKENLNELLQALTITDRTNFGINIVTAKICAVVYPYTEIQDIFSDLSYALRQEKEVLIYIPEKRLHNKTAKLLHSTGNINMLNKIISDLNYKTQNLSSMDRFLNELRETYLGVIKYLNIDEAGIIVFDDINKEYQTKLVVNLSNEKPSMFKEGEIIDAEFVNEIKDASDTDGCLFFSNRKKVIHLLGRVLDKKRPGSGFLFNLTGDTGRTSGIVYFLNGKDKEIQFDSYIRESVVTISALTLSAINTCLSKMVVHDLVLREENLLKATSYFRYTINKETYDIVDFSDSFKRIIPEIKVGEKCYKLFFGNSKPCKNCPLLVKNKQLKNIRGNDYQVSYSINNKVNNNAELLLKNIKSEEELTNRFDPETAISSIYGFLERLKALYLTKAKGYVITLAIDNAPELMKKNGNEGYSMLLRLFANDVVSEVLKDEEIYLYKNNTLVIVMAESGKIDVLDALENIYNLSKKDYLKDDSKLLLNIGYTAIKFPQEFTHPEDLIRHIERTLDGRDLEKVKTDFIHLEENGFMRPASRKEYILNIVDDAVQTNKLIIKMQPVINGASGRVFGAELLIRLTDVERDTMLNTPEVIRVAAENHKINIISDKLLDFVGQAYGQYGAALFRQNEISRISINADFAYFTQHDFIDKINQIIEKNNIENNFIVFEITEKELSDHFTDFKNNIRELKRLNIPIVCDQYTGSHLSLENINELNISEIKTDRGICADIDISTEKLNNVKKLVNDALALHIKPTLLGIENSQQYALLKEFSKEINMQGYYFYHPLDLSEFVTIIKRNVD